MTSFIAAGGSGRSISVIPAVPAASSVTTIAFMAIVSSLICHFGGSRTNADDRLPADPLAARSPRSPATSSAQYPAASGVDVSVSLRQPHGVRQTSLLPPALLAALSNSAPQIDQQDGTEQDGEHQGAPSQTVGRQRDVHCEEQQDQDAG